MHVFPIDRTKFINCEAKQHFQHRLVFACIYPCIQSLKCDNVPHFTANGPSARLLSTFIIIPFSSLYVHKWANKGQRNNSQKIALNASNITKYHEYVIIIKNLKYNFLIFARG